MFRRLDRLARAITLLLLAMACAAPAAAPDAPATRSTDAAATATLRIEVTDLRRQKGQLVSGVFRSGDGFPTDGDKAAAWAIKPADTDPVVFTVDLPPGQYGASVLHDENNNAKMDRNLIGIPKEGYGVTNNPKPKRRAATFEESRFTLPAEGATLTISIQYF
jgi:uncharacterized protein (DUF2141 family)